MSSTPRFNLTKFDVEPDDVWGAEQNLNADRIDAAAKVSELVTVSGHLQNQISSIVADEIEPALVGVDGITVASGSSTITLTGFRTEFVSASGSLQSQIDAVEASDVDSVNSLAGSILISGKGTVAATIEGQTIVISGTSHTPVPRSLIGSNGVTVTSGSNTDTISGFYSEFVSASGSLQGQAKAIVSNSSNLTVTSGSNVITLAPSATPNYTSVTATTITGTTGQFSATFSAQEITSANSVRAATISGSTVTGTTGRFSGAVSAESVSASNSLTVSGAAVLTQVKVPSMRIPFGNSAGVLTSYAGLTWNNVGSSQDALQATHLTTTLSGTDSDPWLHGGSSVGRTSGLSYVDAFGVFPVFTWSIQGVPTYRIVSSAFGARQVLDVGVGITKTNMTMFGRLTGTGQSVITLHNNTTAQRNALVGTQDAASAGSLCYNTTTSGVQAYHKGDWNQLVMTSGNPFKSGANQGAAGALAGEIYINSVTNALMVGV